MSARQLLEDANIFQVCISFAVLTTILYRRVASVFPAVVGYLSILCVCGLITVPLVFFRTALHIPNRSAYDLYVYTYFVAQVACLAVAILIIYGLFSEAMRPFQGLQRIGRIAFRWVGFVSLAVSLALVTGPQVLANPLGRAAALQSLVSQLQQGTNVLILCLLIFVCFSIRPLGLTFRSHLFGVVLGLGINATTQLVAGAWFAVSGSHSMYSPVQIFSSFGIDASILVWGIYFALPEPKRKMILLPTTSPFFLWNRISEVLGDAPGHVAVAGFSPDMLAPAEIEVLTAAIVREEEAAAERDAELHELQGNPVRDALPERSMPHITGSLALSR